MNWVIKFFEIKILAIIKGINDLEQVQHEQRLFST